MDKGNKILTPTEFADKNGLSRATVWRWLTKKHLKIRFKMYDAEIVKVAGRNFIQIPNGKKIS